MSETYTNLLGPIDIYGEENYKRTKSKLRSEATNLIKSLYGSGYCELTSSGINAIYVTFKAIFTLIKKINKIKTALPCLSPMKYFLEREHIFLKNYLKTMNMLILFTLMSQIDRC